MVCGMVNIFRTVILNSTMSQLFGGTGGEGIPTFSSEALGLL